ncbi:MAG: PEP-CTERM sorting domain-containing protein, partial [Planctomycetota bacterium]|nr:PEP-CTERM sorting domain-containing protein [Planctomycetota bacterium]
SGRGTLIADGGHMNYGAMTFSSGPTDVYGDMTNWGTVISTGGATVTFYDDVDNSGEIRTSTGCATVFLGALTGGGSFTGTGTVYIEGDLRPGHSPAVIEFETDVFFGSRAIVVAELGGNVRGSQYDAMIFGATAALDGDLAVTLLGGFVPQAGQTFDLFDWTTLAGTFDAVTLPALPSGLSWDTSDLYSGGSITVAPEPATLALMAMGVAGALLRRRRK